MQNTARIFTYCFAFGRIVMIPVAQTTHEHQPLLRTREQAAQLIRLGALVRKGTGSPATWKPAETNRHWINPYGDVIDENDKENFISEEMSNDENATGIVGDRKNAERVFNDQHREYKAQRRAESGYAQ